jgi:phage regulator Rha-like protein
MSSREIAELTGKAHSNVIRDIRVMLEALGEAQLSFESGYRAGNGQRRAEFRLPKDLTITLVPGYNVTMRHRIVTRWQELEAQSTPRLPQNLGEALRLAADNWEAAETAKAQALQLAYKVQQDAPKVLDT